MSTQSPDVSTTPPVAIVGAGAVGTVLGRRLAACGYTVEAVFSRTRAAAERLALRLGANLASDTWADWPDAVRFVFVCVPDDAVASVASALARRSHPWAATVVAHTSGALPASALAPLAGAGAMTLSFHPMQALTRTTPPDAFADLCVGLEGDPDAVAFGTQVAERLGAQPVVLSAGGKVSYHLAAALASGGLVTLLAVALEVMEDAGVDEETGRALLLPLLKGTLRNLEAAPPSDVLTGPAARGDEGTLDRHLEALRQHRPHLIPLYASLTAEMVHVAVRGQRLPSRKASATLDRLQHALENAP